MAEIEQHLTIEQLSASLDGQLSQSEQEYAQQHLSTCEQCQQQQSELRQTAALLHALPQPALPRSFVLPLDTSFAESTVAPETKSRLLSTQTARPTRRTFWPPYLRTSIRVVSTLAAAVGIVFLLSSLFPMLAFPTTTSSGYATSMPSAAIPKDVSVTQETMEPHKAPQTPLVDQTKATSVQAQGTPSQSQNTPVPLITPGPHTAFAPSNARPVDPSQAFFTTLLDLSTSQGRTTLGFMLLVLGILGLMVFRRRKSIS